MLEDSKKSEKSDNFSNLTPSSQKKKFQNFLYLHLIFLFYSFISIISKQASIYTLFSINFLLFYGISILLIFIYAILWQQIIKKFDLTSAFSQKGIVIFWTFLWAVIFFKEIISLSNILGAILIIGGIIILGREQ